MDAPSSFRAHPVHQTCPSHILRYCCYPICDIWLYLGLVLNYYFMYKMVIQIWDTPFECIFIQLNYWVTVIVTLFKHHCEIGIKKLEIPCFQSPFHTFSNLTSVTRGLSAHSTNVWKICKNLSDARTSIKSWDLLVTSGNVTGALPRNF